MLIGEPPLSYIYAILLICFMQRMLNFLYENGTSGSALLRKACRMLSFNDQIQEKLYSRRFNAIGPMMAFSYVRFLKTAGLKAFRKRIEDYKTSEDVVRMEYLLILIPSSCKFQKLLNFEIAQNLEPHVCDSAGTQNRQYLQAVYKATNKSFGKKRPYFAVDMPMCLLTLNSQFNDAGFSNTLSAEEKERIVSHFTSVLLILLQDDPICNRLCRIITYNDWRSDFSTWESIMAQEGNTSVMPEYSMDSVNWEHLGFSLAFQYYSNFLCRVLSDLPYRIKKWVSKKKCKMYPKLIVIVPHSFIPMDLLTDVADEGLEYDFVSPLRDHIEDVGVLEDFTYQQSVYRVRTNGDKDASCHFTAVCPNTDFIDEIRKECRWNKNIVRQTMGEFLVELKRFVAEGKPNYSSVCDILDYNDIKGEVLSARILELVSNSAEGTA